MTTARKIGTYGLRALLALLVTGGLVFFLLPPYLESLLVRQLSQMLHRPVSIESIRIRPDRLSAQVDGLAIQEKGGGPTVAAFATLSINLEASSLLHGGPVISEVRLVAPMLKIVRHADGRLNFSDLIDEWLARPPSNEPTPAFSINNIRITNGRIEIDDQLLGEEHLLSDVQVSLPFVSSLPDATEVYVEPEFSASIDGAPLRAEGRSKPFSHSLESELKFTLRDLHLARYLAYLPVRLPIEVASGNLSSDLRLVFRRPANEPPSVIVSGNVAVTRLAANDRAGAPLLACERLHVQLAALDPLRNRYEIERVVLDKPEVHVRVSRAGTINLLELLPQEPNAPTAAEQPPAARPTAWSLASAELTNGLVHWLDDSHGKAFSASIDDLHVHVRRLHGGEGGEAAEFDGQWRMQAGKWLAIASTAISGGRLDLANREVSIDRIRSRGGKVLLQRLADGVVQFVPPPSLRLAKAARSDPSGAWKLRIASVSGEDYALRYEDQAISPATVQTIAGLTVSAENVSSDLGSTTKIATQFRINGKGAAQIGGSVRLAPLKADLALALHAIELLPWQPYFGQHLNIELTRGQVTLGGTLQLAQASDGDFSADKLGGRFTGQITISDLHAVDKINAADFVKWKSLHLARIDLRLNPNSLTLGEVALADFFARAIVSPAGKLNLLQIVRQDSAPPATPAPASVTTSKGTASAAADTGHQATWPIKVGKITLQGGDIHFTDHFVKPNYSARLRKVGGSIDGLSSANNAVASLDLRGSYDNIAPVTAIGRLNPLASSPYLDLEAEVKGIEMTSLSPYSGKYAGYAIEKGKLSLFVKYKIENRQLAAENRIFLDQLTFGDPVDSADATTLPVTLAVALLKNRHGEIDINLPIKGSLDDPEFSVGGLIVKVIVNLLARAATSPFALLASVLGSNEELASIDFAPGQAVLSENAQQRLDKLAHALLERPSLRLEIEGHAHSESDPEGLRRDRLQSKVRALKRGEMTKKGIESGESETVEISNQDYTGLLERVYLAEPFPKPRNIVGLVKKLPVDEMEKLILSHSPIDHDSLHDLGERRATAVRDWLVTRSVPAARLFLLPARIDKPADNGKPAGSPHAATGRVAFALK